MAALWSLLLTIALVYGTSLHAAAPPVSATPGAMRLGSDRLRVGGGRLVVAPNGRMLASGGTGGVCFWELPSGKVMQRFEYPDYFEGVPHAFCPESRWLALTSNQSISDDSDRNSSFDLLDVQNGKRFSLLKIDDPLDFWSAAFLNRGRAVCCLVWTSPPMSEVVLFDLHLWALPSRKKLGRLSDVTCFAISSGSDVVVTGHEDGTIQYRNAADLTKVKIVQAHSRQVEHLALSPDGRTLASSCVKESPADEKARPRANPVVLWDVASRKCLRTFREFGGTVSDLRFTTNDALCGFTEEGYVSVYDTKSGRAITPAPIIHNGINPPSFSADGSEVVTFDHDLGRVEIRQVARKEPVLILRKTPEVVFRVNFVNAGRGVLVDGSAVVPSGGSFGWPGTWCGVWDRATGAALYGDPGHRAKITKVAYSCDGKTLVSLDEAGELRLTRLPGGTPHPSFSTKAAGWVKHFQLTLDGKQICAIGIDGRAAFWDIASGKRLRSLDLLGKDLRDDLEKRIKPFWQSIYSSPLGENLVLDAGCRVAVVRYSDKHFDVVRLDSGKRTRFPFTFARLTYTTPMVISGDGRYLAVNREYGFELYDLSNGKVILEKDYGGTSFAFSPDGRYLAWGEGNDVCLFDLQKRTTAGRLVSDEENFSPRAIAFAADGKTLAANDNERILYWDLETKTRREAGFLREPNAASLTKPPLVPLRSGAVLSSETFLDEERMVRIRDITTGMGLFPQMDIPEGDKAYEIAVSPDERVIAVGGRVVTLIERFTGKEIVRLPRYHRGLISAMTFSPDGHTLTTGATDASVFVWDWKTLCGSKSRRHALSAVELLRCEHGLSSDDAGSAYACMGRLAGDPAQAVPLCRNLLAASNAEGVRVGQWLRDLDDDSFEKRERAARSLADLGGEWTAALREVSAKTPSAEVKKRIAGLLFTVGKADWSPRCIRTLRTIALLEEIGSPTARLVLNEGAKGTSNHPVTREAKASRERMKK